MKTTMFPLSLIGMGCLGLAVLTGCQDRAHDEIPGTLPSGPIEHVDNETAVGGGGGVPADVSTIGVIQQPLTRTPTEEEVYAAEYIHFWVFAKTSPALHARRQGYYITLRTREDQYADERAIREDRLRLNQLNNIHLDENGQLVIDKAKSLEPNPDDLNEIRKMGVTHPWHEKGQGVSRTTVVFPTSGQAVTTMQPASPTGGVGQSPNVSTGDIERSIQAATRALQNNQNLAGSLVPPGAPQPPARIQAPAPANSSPVGQ